MRIGIFGGTFDPVHFGHLLLAESCREQCPLDEVWFVPAAIPPHKQQRRTASPQDRIRMLELAIAGHPAFRVSEIELDRGGISYTVDTLAQVRAAQPDAELFLLMGADSLADLPNWREPGRICKWAVPITVVRRGSPAPDYSCLKTLVDPPRLERIRSFAIDMPVVEFSSSEIRERIARAQSIRFRTPRAVEKYIQSNGLYT